MTQITSTALVATDRPERWRKQLAAHFARKVEVQDVVDGTLVTVGAGRCRMADRDGALLLEVHAADEASRDRLEDVVGGHLERFAVREGLVVTWQRGTP